MSAEEIAGKQLVIEGVLSIQAGANPRVLDDMLSSYLPPKVRAARAEDKKSA
jgi:chemotaxis protein MotA